ncbi:OmpA family protein [Bacteroides sp. OF04-15BH]|jgi:OOP family OmpA-OmpF porin|uniref:OmpA family protein n=1 Tax=Bacteroides sp. OF04-15BH TaxID=2292281 RepID=UPI001F3CEF33|nr:OmpA family protein [Bacteroides sp. OF04-15BH]
MTKFRFLCMAAALMLGCGQAAWAQGTTTEKNYKSYPHMFFGLHGGGQITFTDYKPSKLITPLYGASLGGYFNPVVGTRLHVSGYQAKGGVRAINETYDYKYVTTDIDVILNLTNLFSKKHDHLFNVLLFGGVGLNYAWDNDDMLALNSAGKTHYSQAWDDNLLSHNARVGMQLDVNLAKHVGLNLEVMANSLSDKFNSKMSSRNDWQLTASLGLAFKFAYKDKKAQPAPVVEEVWETRKDTVWYDDVTYKNVPVQDKLESQIYYNISLSEPKPQAKINEIVEFVKNHKNCKISVTSYADKGTGNPTINMKYSEERTKNVVDALVKAGVDKNIITAESKGDSVQPFAENDKNRVTITVVTGEGTKKEKVVTKKFRIEETRYRVK